MTDRGRSVWLAIAAAALVAVALGAGAWAFLRDERAAARTVKLLTDDGLFPNLGVDDAMEEASRVVGFPVRLLYDAPAGFVLVQVQASQRLRTARMV
ncbi:MAG: hypothetical protein ACR2HN_08720 [Tepidiformaceae bacterium]